MKLFCYALLPVLTYAAYLAHVGGERVWCAVFLAALERLRLAGRLVLDGEGWYRAPGPN
jgi:hypothetical protein